MRKVLIFSFGIMMAGITAITPVLAVPPPTPAISRTQEVYLFNTVNPNTGNIRKGVSMFVTSVGYRDRLLNNPDSEFVGGAQLDFDLVPFNSRLDRCAGTKGNRNYLRRIHVFKHKQSKARFYVTRYIQDEATGLNTSEENPEYVRMMSDKDNYTYKYNGNKFCGVSKLVEGSVPVYSLYSNMEMTGATSIRQAYYTTDLDEAMRLVTNNPNQWVFKGIAFYGVKNDVVPVRN